METRSGTSSHRAILDDFDQTGNIPHLRTVKLFLYWNLEEVLS
jgi:hypothetical protein